MPRRTKAHVWAEPQHAGIGGTATSPTPPFCIAHNNSSTNSQWTGAPARKSSGRFDGAEAHRPPARPGASKRHSNRVARAAGALRGHATRTLDWPGASKRHSTRTNQRPGPATTLPDLAAAGAATA